MQVGISQHFIGGNLTTGCHRRDHLLHSLHQNWYRKNKLNCILHPSSFNICAVGPQTVAWNICTSYLSYLSSYLYICFLQCCWASKYDVIHMHISPHFVYVLLVLKLWPEIYTLDILDDICPHIYISVFCSAVEPQRCYLYVRWSSFPICAIGPHNVAWIIYIHRPHILDAIAPQMHIFSTMLLSLKIHIGGSLNTPSVLI